MVSGGILRLTSVSSALGNILLAEYSALLHDIYNGESLETVSLK